MSETQWHSNCRPCICGAFWGLDLAQPHSLRCLCGENLQVIPVVDGGWSWRVQHGTNPEHRSPAYKGAGLLGICDWVDAVHGCPTAPTEGR